MKSLPSINFPYGHAPLGILSVFISLCLVTVANGKAYQKIEATFQLPQVQGNPFDAEQNDVEVVFTTPAGSQIKLMAFFDGQQTWRVRHTPETSGRYVITSITLNGRDARPQGLATRDFEIEGHPRPGFIRIDPRNSMRFAFDDGSPYYPVGYNMAWRYKNPPETPTLVDSLRTMGTSGVNWTRIWMCFWDGKDLDWSEDSAGQPALGTLSLSVAKQWDTIVDAADDNGVFFQLVLQSHGQLSTTNDANWAKNPLAKVNGGWLTDPTQFFSDSKAIALTKNKYRYIVARWGYSPSIMAWELFNEVQSCDAFKTNRPAVTAWLLEMTQYIRRYDNYRHLLTVSSQIDEPSIWPMMDFYQAHVYPPDILSAIAALDAEHLGRPYFYGEIGGSAQGKQIGADDVVHRSLWGSLMSGSSGAAQYWYWDTVQAENLEFHYAAVHKFVMQSGFTKWSDTAPIEVFAKTPDLDALRFGPGLDWAPSKQTAFDVKPNGRVDGVGGMSSFLQGQSNNLQMFPFADFHVNYPVDGTFAIRVDLRAEKGARLEVCVDKQRVAALNSGFIPPATSKPTSTQAVDIPPRPPVPISEILEVPVSAGEHQLRLENTGPDWIHLREFVLSPYTSQLGVLAKGNRKSATLWVYRRSPGGAAVSGTLSVPGLEAGKYLVVWWDTYKGEVMRQDSVSVGTTDMTLTLATPSIASDIAAWIERAK